MLKTMETRNHSPWKGSIIIIIFSIAACIAEIPKPGDTGQSWPVMTFDLAFNVICHIRDLKKHAIEAYLHFTSFY